MDKHTQQFKVRLGLFILGGIALFVIAIFIIGKQQNLFNPVFKLTTTFKNVSGLQVGSNIRFSGIDVGTVNNIKIINDSTVWVEMMIKKDVQQFIKADCEAGIGSSGIIGDRVLIIAQGQEGASIVKDGQSITSNEPVETDDIIASLEITAQYTEVVAKQLAEVMLKFNSGKGTLGRLIHDSIMAQNIGQTIANVKKSSEGLDETIEETKENVFNLLTSFQSTADNVEVFTKEMEEMVVKINNGYGTLGKLVEDTTIAKDLSQTITNLKTSSKSLDENLEALKHNIFFRGYFKQKAKDKKKRGLEEKD